MSCDMGLSDYTSGQKRIKALLDSESTAKGKKFNLVFDAIDPVICKGIITQIIFLNFTVLG